MNKTTVYDLPTRIFHWLFAALFLAALLIAQYVDDDSALFSFHMLAGLSMVFLLVLRIIWGFTGTAYARFSSFRMNPAELLGYLKEAFLSKTKRYLGHGPASSWAAVVMFLLTAGLAFTGMMMAGGYGGDVYEEAHEVMANLFLITVILHVAGIIYHNLRHRDGLWSSMFDGKKEALAGKSGISTTRPLAGIALLIIFLAWIAFLGSSYDSADRTLHVAGTEWTLGEDHHDNHESDDEGERRGRESYEED